MLAALFNRIRRNHALEHATINLVTQSYPMAKIAGFSGPLGFTLYTSLTAEEIVPAVRQSLKRLKNGEHNLRIHANCGTNLVVTATLTTLTTLFGVHRKPVSAQKRLERLPHLILLNVLALLAARPLGEWIQSYVTTDTNLSDTEIASIFTDYQGGLRRIRVHTRQV